MIFTTLAACLLLQNATVIDPSTADVRPRNVVIRDGKIADVHDSPSSALRAPSPRTRGEGKQLLALAPRQRGEGGRRPGEGPCDRKVDLTGKFLVPGFVDMHAHILNHAWDEKGDIRPRYDRPSVERMLRTLLAFGVTTIRDPGSETEAAVTFRKLVSDGVITGPAIFTAGRIINASRFDPEPFMPVRTADDIRREIRWQAAAGVDVIKIYSSTTPELAKVAIDEAHARRLPIIGHLQLTTWTEAARMGIDGVEHAAPWASAYLDESKRAGYRGGIFERVFWLNNTDPKLIAEMIDALAVNRVVVDPTLIAMHTKFFGNDPRWLQNPDNALVPAHHLTGWRAFSFTKDWTAEQYAEAQRAWPRLQRLMKQMFDAGVAMTVGSDMPTPWIVPGASVHDEMALLAGCGIPAMAVLKMATANAAAALHRTNAGSIRAGMRADLIVLSKNPLDDIRNTRSIVKVFHNGVEYDPAKLLQP